METALWISQLAWLALLTVLVAIVVLGFRLIVAAVRVDPRPSAGDEYEDPGASSADHVENAHPIGKSGRS